MDVLNTKSVIESKNSTLISMTLITPILLCVFFILNLFFFTGCEGCALVQEPMVDDAVPLDTIQYTYEYDTTGVTQDTVTLYAWTVNRYGMKWVDTSRVRPLILDSVYRSFGEISIHEPQRNNFRSVIFIQHECDDCAPWVNPFLPVDTMHIAYYDPLDTIFLDAIYRNCYPRHIFDTIWAEVDPDSTESFFESHSPRITNKEELQLLVDTLQEGYLVNAHLLVEHLPFDGVWVEQLSDTIPFVTRPSRNCTVEPEGKFYLSSRAAMIIMNECKPIYLYKANSIATDSEYAPSDAILTLQFRPDSAYVGNEYEQVFTVKNRYGAGDTVRLKSYIVPFDSTVFNQ
ncbi:MAG: hypothetical protein OCC49_18420 [Fibrobacterales bacterium]